jgi:hypothetical protein
MRVWRATAATLGLTLTLSVPLPAQGDEESPEEPSSPAEHGEQTIAGDLPASPEEGDFIPDLVFARMVENPVSGVTRVPVVNATLFGVPPNDRVANAFVLAPILPVLFRGGWSLVTRTVIPAVVTVPVGTERRTGFGDITSEVLGHKLFKGRKNQFFDIALGSFVGFPSASDDFLGTGRWRLGPELILGISAKKWVTMLVVRNQWSVGSNRARADVNALLLDYLLFYNLPKLFYLVYEPAITADWEASRGDRWTLPVGIGFGRHHRLPKRPRLAITTRLSGLYNAVRTNSAPKGQLLFTLVFWKPNPAAFDVD